MVAIIFLMVAILAGIGSYFSYLKACQLSSISTEIVDVKKFEQNFTMSYEDMVKYGIVKEYRSKNIFFTISIVLRVICVISLVLNVYFSL